MFEQIKKTFDKSVELAFSTKDKIQHSVLEIARENNLTTEEAKKLLDQFLKKSEEIKKTLEDKITELQKAAIVKMNLVSKKELDILEERIILLEKRLKTPARSKAPLKSPIAVVKKKIVRKK
jgi:polyhydroxyalkanoate synthesis regulator phasin